MKTRTWLVLAAGMLIGLGAPWALAAVSFNAAQPGCANGICYMPNLLAQSVDAGAVIFTTAETSDFGLYISDSQDLTTSAAMPDFRQQGGESGVPAGAFEFLAGVSGAWVNGVNSIFTVTNGVGGSGFATDIFGNITNQISLLDKVDSFTPADQNLDIVLPQTAGGVGWISLADVVYSYTVNGVAGGDTFFTLSATDGVSTATIDLPCQALSTTQPVAVGWTGTVAFSAPTLSFDITNTANCSVAPLVRSLFIYYVNTLQP